MKLAASMVAACALLGLAACGGETKPAETPVVEAPTPPAPEPAPVATAAAQETPADPAAFMKTRHENFEDLGKNFKVLVDNNKAEKPDLPAVQAAAAKVNEYAGKIGTWFPPGTGPETGNKTLAKAEVWTDRATFDAALAKLQEEAGKMVTAAGTDAAAFKAQFGATGGSCKNCHDKFRAEKK